MGRPALQLLRDVQVFEADRLEGSPRAEAVGLDLPAIAGRLVEISGRGAAARLSLAASLVREAQESGEPAAWIGCGHAGFFPPDLAASGVDLAALAVVRAPDPIRALDAAVRLGRSGAFGLLVVDLTSEEREGGPDLPPAALTRMVGLARKHELAAVFLTDKAPADPSLQSLVSLRLHGERDLRARRAVFEAVKDKARGPGWTAERAFLPPAGLEREERP